MAEERWTIPIVFFRKIPWQFAIVFGGQPAAPNSNWRAPGNDYHIQFMRGRCFVHSRKVIHRDLKPDDILLGKTDSFWKAVIADFGNSATVPQCNRPRQPAAQILWRGGPGVVGRCRVTFAHCGMLRQRCLCLGRVTGILWTYGRWGLFW